MAEDKNQEAQAPEAQAEEAVKPEAPKQDAQAEEAPKPEGRAQEAPKPEAKAKDAPKPEAKAKDAPKPEAKAKDAPKPEAGKPADYTPRLKRDYDERIVPAMIERFGYKNRLEVPRLDKIVLNMGVGEATQDKKKVETAAQEMELIAGQKPVITKAKKSIAQFKLRSEERRVGKEWRARRMADEEQRKRGGT